MTLYDDAVSEAGLVTLVTQTVTPMTNAERRDVTEGCNNITA